MLRVLTRVCITDMKGKCVPSRNKKFMGFFYYNFRGIYHDLGRIAAKFFSGDAEENGYVAIK